ncbi:MAG: FixH family protein [Deltaproteobacteria bacterium]|uniref:FixH family protein n=1 Tax=Candidatus Deferrimicrobium sp. TaxID=3060586 RepID=UPI002724D342|nr:FixH family protein [Candidatus Deferrimicrobium sp.]MCR4308936.1 FixH family protein [Deltaproteobacteria bacterium]MDO8738911.1 FixH family protein [Candidatus Deferrimicrobium sp.]
MKRLIGGLFAGFALVTGATIYIAHRSYDGLVDRRYYEAGSNEFAEREAEAREGFTATFTDRYRAGNNRFRGVLSTSAGPLRGARVTLDTMRLGGPGDDRSFALREEAPGAYAADVFLPVPGQWIFALSVDAGRLHPRRRWTAVVPPSDAAGILRGAIGGQEVLLSITPWPPKAMREADFTVSLPGYAGTASPYVDLSMAGMEMGRNRVDLSRGADGRYRGTGVFVRCPSGRHDWEATVIASGAGKAVFRFAVAD